MNSRSFILTSLLNIQLLCGYSVLKIEAASPTLSYNFILLAKCVGDIFEYRFAIC
jgi:hypothetical protein